MAKKPYYILQSNRYHGMVVKNGKIVKCTDDQLHSFWCHNWSDVYDYPTYKRLVIDLGTEVY